MKRLSQIALLVLLILVPVTSGLTQTRSRKHLCTVNLVGGDFVKGYFVGANSRSVTVEVDGVRQTIKLDRVTNILFIVDFKNRKMEERN